MHLTQAQEKALVAVVEYLWQEERRHCEEQEPADRDQHIFTSLQVLGKALGRNFIEIKA